VREIVIVVADLYWPADVAESELSVPPGSLPGLAQASRFGQVTRLTGSWRGWLAHWLGRDDVAAFAPGSCAASLVQSKTLAAAPASAWIATPVHLLAGLTSVHLERRGVLPLAPADAQGLAEDFAQVFAGSGFELRALPASSLLLVGPHLPQVRTVEPPRAVGTPLGEAQPEGDGALVLRRLLAEIEMWLHGHAVNLARTRRGEPPVSALWPWGGGPVPTAVPPATAQPGERVFAADLWCRVLVRDCQPVPDTLKSVLGYAEAQRAAVILEAGPLLQPHPEWTLIEALKQLDADFIAPAVQALRSRSLGSLVLIANDRALAMQPRQMRRWWRRASAPLSGLIA
jgi:hypothetical protein